MKENRQCFVIMPFGERVHGTLRIDFDKIYDGIIRPAVEGLKKHDIHIRCEKCDRIALAGPIHERMIRRIADADVAVVDITTRNPNVMYELGVRHALRDRVTVMIRHKGVPEASGAPLPFNISGMNTIEYAVKPEAEADQARTEIANLVLNGLRSSNRDSLVYSVLPGLRASGGLKRIVATQVESYPVPKARRARIGIVTGDLRHTNMNATLRRNPLDVWVSSENTNMEMARIFDDSVSGLIRWLAAEKNHAGRMKRDIVDDELRTKLGPDRPVYPGIVVTTGAGQLAATHKVKRIFHAAAVYGTIGSGFHTIENVEQCVTNALACADAESPRTGKQKLESLLFPVFGTGTARAGITDHAKPQLSAAIDYLVVRRDHTVVKRVYFLAKSEQHLAALRVALTELGVARGKPRRRSRNAASRQAADTRAARRTLRGAVTSLKFAATSKAGGSRRPGTRRRPRG